MSIRETKSLSPAPLQKERGGKKSTEASGRCLGGYFSEEISGGIYGLLARNICTNCSCSVHSSAVKVLVVISIIVPFYTFRLQSYDNFPNPPKFGDKNADANK